MLYEVAYYFEIIQLNVNSSNHRYCKLCYMFW
jgi:hypothetical protein